MSRVTGNGARSWATKLPSRRPGQYAVNPANQEFIKEYRAALQAFLRKHRDDVDPDLIEEYEQELNQARAELNAKR
jgi:hypothetical protein